MDRDTLDAIGRAAAILAAARHAVALTGAGISKESGIPTFRGEGGLWTRRGEPPADGYRIFLEDPEAWWRQRLDQLDHPDEFRLALDAAAPNDGHRALAALEELGALRHVITQNVDDLHRRAGTRSLTEIHGNTQWLRCIGCGARWPRAEFPVDRAALPPRCSRPGCGAVVKGDGVMFGEPIPPEALERCALEARRADAFMIVGTTALVYPAAEYPQMAVRRGAPLIEVDPEPTALSDVAAVVLRGPAGELLPALAEAVRARAGAGAGGGGDGPPPRR